MPVAEVDAVVAQCSAGELRRTQQARAELLRRAQHRAGQGRIVGLGIVVPEHRFKIGGFQAVERRPQLTWHAAEMRVTGKPRQQRVQRQADAQLPWAAARLPVDREVETLQAHQCRCEAKQRAALVQALAHQVKLPGLQVTQSAVDQFAGTAGRAGGDGGLLEQHYRMAGSGGGLRHAGAVNTGADHGHIDVECGAHAPGRAGRAGRGRLRIASLIACTAMVSM